MKKRVVQLVVVISLFALSGVAKATDMTCRDICFWQMGVCQGQGYTWNLDCGDESSYWHPPNCDLDSACVH